MVDRGGFGPDLDRSIVVLQPGGSIQAPQDLLDLLRRVVDVILDRQHDAVVRGDLDAFFQHLDDGFDLRLRFFRRIQSIGMVCE